MAFKINNDTFTPNRNFDSISVSGSYHTISEIHYAKIDNGTWPSGSTTGITHIEMNLYNSSGSYAAGSGSYKKTSHSVTVDWTNNQNILSCSYEALKSQVSSYSGSVHVIDV